MVSCNIFVARFGVQGRKTRKSGVTSHKSGVLRNTTQNVTQNKHCHFFFGGSLSLTACVCSLLLSPLLQAGGALFMSLRQSLESNTGVNHHSLANRFTASLRTRSPLSAFHLPTPPSPQRPLKMMGQIKKTSKMSTVNVAQGTLLGN